MKTSFFSIFTAIIVSIFCFNSASQDNAQIGLPEGAIARIGKGSLGQIHFSPDGSKLAVSTSIGIWFHDPNTGKELELLQRPNISYPYAFAFSPDGNTIAIGVKEKKKMPIRSIRYPVELWNVTTGEEKEMPVGHLHRIKPISFSPDGNYVASVGGFSNTDRLWNTQTGESISIKRMHAKGVNLVLFSLDGPTFVTVGYNNTAYLWDGKTGNHKITLSGHSEQVSSVAYSPDNKTIATGSWDGTIWLWDATTGTQQTTLTSNKESVWSVAFSPDGNSIVCGTGNGNVQLWDIQIGKLKSTLTGHTESVESVTYSPDGKIIASASWDDTVRLWDAATGETKAILTGYMNLSTAAYSPDGTTIATGSGNDKVRLKVQLWDAKTGKIKNTFSGWGNIARIAYSPDGETIAIAIPYDTVFLLDVQTGKLKAKLKHFGLIGEILNEIQDKEYSFYSMAYSPDGMTIVTGLDCYTHEKGLVYLWNAKTGRRKRVIYKGKGGVRTAVFSDDGKKIIATGDWQKKTRVWDAKTGKELTPTPTDIPNDSQGLLYSPDGTTTAHIEPNGTVLIRKKDATSQRE
ncbi:MAG: WD40 repeat domain-containing protein [Candidatus Poribacteria bacterium]|nr:WD40 repeat domain-containing protein [Candidatus Poribacteria bacterium]